MKSMTLAPLGPLSRLLLASLLFTGAAACAPGRFTVDGLCEAEAKATCHFQYNCCNASERADAFKNMQQSAPYDDESSCVEVYTRTLCDNDARVIDSVDAERATWDDTKAETCYKPIYDALDACDAATVFSFKADSPTCDSIIAGKVANNGVCFESYECAVKGSICQPKEPTNPTMPLVTSEGTCVPPAALGEVCVGPMAMKACAPDLYCDFTTMKCAALLADGAACMGSQECKSDNCVQGAMGGMTCAAKLMDGQPCMFDQQCLNDQCDPVGHTCGATKVTYDICLGKNK